MGIFFRNKNLFEFIWKWRWIYGLTIILAIIVSIIFSGPDFIKPKFKSFAIVYPSNLQKYSEESSTEQMLQILQSEQLKLKLIDVFHLYSHYNIDTKYKYAQTAVFNELKDNVSISKTSYESVKIEMLDYYPDTAKMMVDSIISFYNQIIRKVHNLKYKEVIDLDKKRMDEILYEKDSLGNLLLKYREKYKLYMPDKQNQKITEKYLENNAKAKELYENMLAHSSQINFLDSLVKYQQIRYLEYKTNYEENLLNYQKKITYANIISEPIPADKKSYPIRWVIVLLSVLGAFLFSFIALVFFESIQEKS